MNFKDMKRFKFKKDTVIENKETIEKDHTVEFIVMVKRNDICIHV